MKFTTEQVRLLAENDRKMDAGEQPFVLDDRNARWAFPGDVLGTFGVVSGQRVSSTVLQALLEANLAHINALIAIDRSRKA
jgi:hypothetical protein